jgi:hypothetical protein
MDLGAYAQIEDLSEIAKKNGIDVPRLRGYRLMKDEKPIDISAMLKREAVYCCENLVSDQWNELHPNMLDYWYCRGLNVDKNKKKYLSYHIETTNSGTRYKVFDAIKWEKIHGKHRKALKFAIKQQSPKVIAQFEMWNKYCGREDVLYIHARIGGLNWEYYDGDTTVATQPWFLDRVDDLDCTYCDIYAKINN